MTDDGNFLSRWSRLKRRVREEDAKVAEPAPPTDEAAPEAAAKAPAEGEGFDLSRLPSLDSLGAGSDYTAFLQKGVPSALRVAALRKLWVTDPDILNYKTLADYDWDFNAPGYGKLLPTDQVKQAVDRILGHLEEHLPKKAAEPRLAEPPPAPTESADDGVEAGPEPGQSAPAALPEAVPEPSPVIAASDGTGMLVPTSDAGKAEMPPRRRRHGGAMPV